MNRIFALIFLVASFGCIAWAEDDSTNQIFQPWGSINSMNISSTIGVSSYHGPIFVSPHSRKAVRGDIYFSPDRKRILVVPAPGPIFASTNSGLSWVVFDKTGTYQFPVSSGPDGMGMQIEVELSDDTLAHSPLMPATNHPPSWYAIGVGQNRDRVIVSADASQPAPILTIQNSGADIVVSWPSNSGSYILQQTIDLSSVSWTDMTNAVEIVGQENQVILPFSMQNHFFRLRSQ